MPESTLGSGGGGAKVLVVDDDVALLRAIGRQLEAAGVDVTTCASSPEAVERIEIGSFDVILSDIDMPGLTGIELLKLLRARHIDVPVVLMTGSPSMDTAVQAVEHGAIKYLMKPLNSAELLATVEKAMQRTSRSATRASVTAGAVLGERYRLVRRIGEGGMSQVWEAKQLRTQREIAVKVLHTALNGHPDLRERLLREARASSQVGHPNVVDVLDAFELPDGTPVLIMPLLRGRTLTTVLYPSRRLPLGDMADLLLPVVSAVGTAHARGVIHRDLKPDNIFVCDAPGGTVVKVLDFGIAKLVGPESSDVRPLTATDTLVGTPGYMSPEQALGERDVDHRADEWSLGAILYETLAGVPPVQVDSVGAMAKVLFTEKIVPLAERAPEVPRVVSSLVDRMLARERRDRPWDLREIYEELSKHARVSSPAFGPPSGPASATAAFPEPESGVLRAAGANSTLESAATECVPSSRRFR
jgi:CheY-like chemotaxis protein/tRNA A-37 threonylcarbamoyl transferase component Bud32